MTRLARFEAEHVYVIPHGIPPAEAHPTAGEHGLFFGRLNAEKGIETLLAAARIATEVPLVIAGEGPLEDMVRRAGATYAGRLDRASMSNMLASSVFTVLPSEWHESFGDSALEALMAGKPVIATRVGALPEIVVDGMNGLIVRPFSPEALAGAMRTLWHDRSLAARLGASGRRVATEQFSLPATDREDDRGLRFRACTASCEDSQGE